jgi:hypothetical protein
MFSEFCQSTSSPSNRENAHFQIDIVCTAPAGGKTLYSIILLDNTAVEGKD